MARPRKKRRAEQRARIKALRKEVKELGGDSFSSGGTDDLSPELEEAFLKHIIDFEKAYRLDPSGPETIVRQLPDGKIVFTGKF
jgi:hypothetical protein